MGSFLSAARPVFNRRAIGVLAVVLPPLSGSGRRKSPTPPPDLRLGGRNCPFTANVLRDIIDTHSGRESLAALVGIAYSNSEAPIRKLAPPRFHNPNLKPREKSMGRNATPGGRIRGSLYWAWGTAQTHVCLRGGSSRPAKFPNLRGAIPLGLPMEEAVTGDKTSLLCTQSLNRRLKGTFSAFDCNDMPTIGNRRRVRAHFALSTPEFAGEFPTASTGWHFPGFEYDNSPYLHPL